MSPDFNITPQKSSEESPNGKYNVPPVLKFAEAGPSIQNPIASVATALTRTAQVGVRQTPVPRSFLQVRGTLEDMRARVASLRERFPDTEVRNCRG